MTKKVFALFIILFALFMPKPVSAHAFGILYNLPVPFWLYLYGAAAALLVSFLIIGYFINKKDHEIDYPIKPLFSLSNNFQPFLKAISVFLFLLTILTGLFGDDSSFSNFNMTFFWVLFLLGFTYFSAIVGEVYSVMNPWRVLVEWFEKFHGQIKGQFKYPKKSSYWPAFVLYFLLIWIELFGTSSPYKLSLILLQYTLINFFGAFAFGKESWFKYCEFFSIFFRLVSRVSIFEKRNKRVFLRPPFVGLIKESVESFSLLVFILFMLSSTAYDGFHTTLPWIRLSIKFSESFGGVLGDNGYQIIQRTGLLLSPFVFLAIYLILVGLMKILMRSKLTLSELARKFAFSLIPIALVYNVAHYYTLLLTQGQEIIRLISDPFGFGWNLFGTANFSSNPAILDAGFVWHSQVAIILIGHIAAVYLSHIVAIELFPSQKKAVFSQLPILALMVIYTTAGLWILSQPIRSGF